MRSILALTCIGLLALAGCGKAKPPKPSPKDDPKTKASMENEPEIILPSFDGPKPEATKPQVNEGPKVDPKPEEKKPAVVLPPATATELAGASAAELVGRLSDALSRDAATAVIRTRGNELVGPLTEMLASPDAALRTNAAFALSLLGKSAEPATGKLKALAQAGESEPARDAAQFALDAIEGK